MDPYLLFLSFQQHTTQAYFPKVYCVANRKDTESQSVKHRRGTRLLPGQPHTNMRAGECLIIRRCNAHMNGLKPALARCCGLL